MKTYPEPRFTGAWLAVICTAIFDIVNGFLIDAVAHSVTGVGVCFGIFLRLRDMHHKLDVKIWLRYLPHYH